MPTYDAILAAPFGALGVRIDGECLTGLEFLPPGTAPVDAGGTLIKQITDELDAYYADPGHRFNLPLAPHGTSFRRKVWHALLNIPAGRTRTYGEVARELASGPRAVGQAVGDNPIPIVIPCHRVIAADGGLGGFMHSRTGYSQDIKRWLLRHEHVL
ncbi:MAG: methylated-DNA--[protein]-cysteine S-methyltransferase [Pseudomonadota bacterium]|nr:methylated-DNA--[protein]-cysteine S-methyltransferase [Pseudomonadota bacterium]